MDNITNMYPSSDDKDFSWVGRAPWYYSNDDRGNTSYQISKNFTHEESQTSKNAKVWEYELSECKFLVQTQLLKLWLDKRYQNALKNNLYIVIDEYFNQDMFFKSVAKWINYDELDNFKNELIKKIDLQKKNTYNQSSHSTKVIPLLPAEKTTK